VNEQVERRVGQKKTESRGDEKRGPVRWVDCDSEEQRKPRKKGTVSRDCGRGASHPGITRPIKQGLETIKKNRQNGSV